MGQSTDAILFYGYCWDEETARPWTIGKDDDEDDEECWEERYAKARGLERPSTPYPYPERTVPRTRENNYSDTPTDYSADELAAIELYRQFWDAKRKLAEQSACMVDTHCSADYPMPYVCIRASRLVSNRGDMTPVTSLAVDPTWREKLDTFCALLGIIPKGEPGWFLVSDWN